MSTERADVRAAGACGHEYEIRYKFKSDGVRCPMRQCRLCGRANGVAPRADIDAARRSGRTIPPFDAGAAETASRADWEAHVAKWDAKREQQERERRAIYDAHIHSPKWRAIRAKVLARSRGMCEGCWERRAVHVHHLTYARLGNEMLFDLAAVCEPCHELIHGHPIGQH